MDCAAEEALVRAELEPLPEVASVVVDLDRRQVNVYHRGAVTEVGNALARLQLGARLMASEPAATAVDEEPTQRRVLRAALLINAAFFALELASGFLARSLGLLADSLDMLADAVVYALSLLAVGGAIATKKRIARWSGYGQLFLAALGVSEVLRRALVPEGPPDDVIMVLVAGLALGANVVTLWMLRRARSTEAHMRASVVFTSNDVILNLGVIVAGGLVYATASAVPDLVVGAVAFAVVARGALRIVRLAG